MDTTYPLKLHTLTHKEMRIAGKLSDVNLLRGDTKEQQRIAAVLSLCNE